MSGGSVALFLRSVVSPRRLVYCAVGNGRVYLPRFHSAKPGKLEPTDEESVGVRRGGVGVGVWRGGKEFDLWKAKQKRFTRHITNLVRKGKVREGERERETDRQTDKERETERERERESLVARWRKRSKCLRTCSQQRSGRRHPSSTISSLASVDQATPTKHSNTSTT